MQNMLQGSVTLFWDIDSCPVPQSLSGYNVVNKILAATENLGIVKSFKGYANLSSPQTSLNFQLRSELQSSGVSLTDCPQTGPKGLVGKVMIVDMFVHAVDNTPPATLVVITGDRSLSYSLSTLRLRQYNVVLISPKAQFGSHSRASLHLDWFHDVLGSEFEVIEPTNDLGVLHSLPTRSHMNTPIAFQSTGRSTRSYMTAHTALTEEPPTERDDDLSDTSDVINSPVNFPKATLSSTHPAQNSLPPPNFSTREMMPSWSPPSPSPARKHLEPVDHDIPFEHPVIESTGSRHPSLQSHLYSNRSPQSEDDNLNFFGQPATRASLPGNVKSDKFDYQRTSRAVQTNSPIQSPGGASAATATPLALKPINILTSSMFTGSIPTLSMVPTPSTDGSGTAPTPLFENTSMETTPRFDSIQIPESSLLPTPLATSRPLETTSFPLSPPPVREATLPPSPSPPPPPPLYPPVPVRPPAPRIIPPHFRNLVKMLQECRARGERKPFRPGLAAEFRSIHNGDITNAGAVDFSQFTQLAEKAGIVELPGREGGMWISLRPELYNHLLA